MVNITPFNNRLNNLCSSKLDILKNNTELNYILKQALDYLSDDTNKSKAEQIAHFLMGKNDQLPFSSDNKPILSKEVKHILYNLLRTHRYNNGIIGLFGKVEDSNKTIQKLINLNNKITDKIQENPLDFSISSTRSNHTDNNLFQNVRVMEYEPEFYSFNSDTSNLSYKNTFLNEQNLDCENQFNEIDKSKIKPIVYKKTRSHFKNNKVSTQIKLKKNYNLIRNYINLKNTKNKSSNQEVIFSMWSAINTEQLLNNNKKIIESHNNFIKNFQKLINIKEVIHKLKKEYNVKVDNTSKLKTLGIDLIKIQGEKNNIKKFFLALPENFKENNIPYNNYLNNNFHNIKS